MEQILQTVHGLLDIEPPAPPPGSNIPAVISVFVLVILLITLTTFAVRYFNNQRSLAKRHLRRLKNRLEEQVTDSTLNRDTAYRLASILSHGLGLNGITSSTPLPTELDQHRERWRLFINNLSMSRFASHTSQASNKKQMFDDAFFWLKNWP
ncbi:MAG: hypothetical protein BMS9Abin25_1502 [Gammaproteobacteria bacterium]|nr:MAG: hypothetical protein BMS9Abin25_1502 [Gammaproteobacteria bacterium]